MVDDDGNHVCFDNNDKFESKSDCDRSPDKQFHRFLAYDSVSPPQPSPAIPSDKCVLEAYYVASQWNFLEPEGQGQKKLEKSGSQYEQDQNKKHFQATEAGDGKISILSFKTDQLLKKQSSNGHFTANGDRTSCGDDCTFILEDLSSSTGMRIEAFVFQ